MGDRLELRKKNNNLDSSFVILFSFQEKNTAKQQTSQKTQLSKYVLGPVFKAIGTINRKCHMNSCCMETVGTEEHCYPIHSIWQNGLANSFFFLPANTVIHKMFKHKYTQHYKKTVTMYRTELQHGAQFSFNQATC